MMRFRPNLPRRHIAIDLGSRCLKFLLMEVTARQFRVVAHRQLDLHEEGVLQGEDASQHVEAVIRDLGDYPIALAISQQYAIAQAVDLPSATEAEVTRYIEAGTLGAGGAGESRVLHDHTLLQPVGRLQHPCWVTIARQENVQQQLDRLGIGQDNVQVVTTVAGALMSAYGSLPQRSENAILVDLGTSQTTIAVVAGGQGVFATSLPSGSHLFTLALAEAESCPVEEAEVLKTTRDYFQGEHARPGLQVAVARWWTEVERTLGEWFGGGVQLPVAASDFQLLFSGGGMQQPGLPAYLQSKSAYRVAEWPRKIEGPDGIPLSRYAVAYGAAMELSGVSAQPVRLLTPRLRERVQQVHQLVWVNTVLAWLLAAVVLLLLAGIWQKFSLGVRKRQLIQQAEAADQKMQLVQALSRRWQHEMDWIRPLAERQKQTMDALQTMQVVQQSKGTNSFWYVLLADQTSYLAGGTTAEGATNVPATSINAAENLAAMAPGFVAELCIPGPADSGMKTLGDLVTALRRNPRFRNVDSVAMNQRRGLVDPKLIIPEHHYALLMEVKRLGTPESVAPPAGAPPPKTAAPKRGFFGSKPKLERSTNSPVQPRK